MTHKQAMFSRKMYQKTFGGRAPPGPAGELIAPPDPLAAKKGPLRGSGGERVGNGRRGRGREEGKWEREGGEREGQELRTPQFQT